MENPQIYYYQSSECLINVLFILKEIISIRMVLYFIFKNPHDSYHFYYYLKYLKKGIMKKAQEIFIFQKIKFFFL
jgi:hypothetical protein